MKKSPIFASIVFALLFALGEWWLSPAGAKDSSAWLDDPKTAFAQAKKEKKLVLLDFTGSTWCPWCKLMQKEVFSTKEFQNYAQQFVLLRVDFPDPQTTPAKGAPLVQKYFKDGDVSLPTILVLSADGKKLGETGYKPGGADVFMADVDEIAKKKAGR
jgi:thiol:disulfide interchange protein